MGREWRIGFSLAVLGALTAASGGAQLVTRERYHIHMGDTLHLQYRLTPDLDQTVTVQPDGFVSLNVAGDLRVADLTVDQARKAILAKESDELADPELTLTLEEFLRPHVTVSGEVAKPGEIEIRANMSALSAILLAGGFTIAAKSGQVLVFRQVNDIISEIRELHLTNVHTSKQLEQDLTLQAGDIVYVPHDKLSHLQHYIQSVNLGAYVNPLQTVP